MVWGKDIPKHSAWKSLPLTHPYTPPPNLPVATIPYVGKGMAINHRGPLVVVEGLIWLLMSDAGTVLSCGRQAAP